MVKRTAPGESVEEVVTLPEDLPDEKLAGKTVNMRITVHSIRGKNIPALDDELAQKAGGFESLADMRQAVEKSYLESRRELYKSAAQKKLLDGLIGQVEYAVPEYLVEQHQAHMLNKLEQRLRKQGKSLDSMEKSAEDIMSESRSGAEEVARAQVFLLSVAKKEGLSATEQEVEAYIKESAARSGQDFQQLASFYQEHGLLGMVRDRMVADKAMDLLYAKAVIKEVPARRAKENETKVKGKTKAEEEK
jgi:trigger factor